MTSIEGQRTIVITGASGFLGSALCREFAARGWRVRAGVRDPGRAPMGDGIEAFECDLPGRLDRRAFAGADVLVHAAYTTKFESLAAARKVNFGGSRRVLRAAVRARVRLPVFISSCSAHDRAESFYGRSKFRIEKPFLARRGLVIRPGLIVGGGGLFERMRQTVSRVRILPLFDGGRQIVQTIALEDAVRGIVRAVERGHRGRIVLAEPEGIAMKDLLRAMAKRQGRRVLFVPVPSGLTLPLLRVAERLGARLPITSENLLGLRGMILQRSDTDLERLGLTVRSARFLI